MLFGAHVSTSGGYVAALDYARDVGAECIQVFAKSPRQWNAKPTDPLAAEAFRSEREIRGFGPVFTHTAYLLNLATPDPVMWEKSVAALADELVRGHVLGAAGVVTHIGTDPDGDTTAAAKRVGEAVKRAFEVAGDCETRLLLENTAGAGSTFGKTFEQLGGCLAACELPDERVGICIDTCHAWASGASVDSTDGWDAYLAGIIDCCGAESIGLLHANDCKFERGSNKDRHEWIGDGFIGSAGFRAMVCHPLLSGVPVVTEMPGDAPEKDRINLGRLKSLRDECSTSQ